VHELLQAEVEEGVVVNALMTMTHSVSEMHDLHHLITLTRAGGPVFAGVWQLLSIEQVELDDLQASKDPHQGRQAVVVSHL
jgi:hypothetical protein